VRTHARNGRSFERCFQGSELVQWLFTHQHASDAADATVVGYTLLYHNLIHHVNDDLHFKDSGHLYRWRYDDNSLICAWRGPRVAFGAAAATD
jgi:hypothetical protein